MEEALRHAGGSLAACGQNRLARLRLLQLPAMAGANHLPSVHFRCIRTLCGGVVAGVSGESSCIRSPVKRKRGGRTEKGVWTNFERGMETQNTVLVNMLWLGPP